MALETLYMTLSSGILFGVVYLHARTREQMLNPGVIYALFWFAYLVISALSLRSLAVPVVGVTYLQIAALLVFVGSQFGVALAARSPAEAAARREASPRLLVRATQIFYALLVLFCVTLFFHWDYQGILLSDFVTDYFATVADVIDRRYTGQIQANPFQAIFLSILYPLPALGGMLVGWRVRSSKLICVMSLVPGALLLLGEGNKGAIPVQLFMFFGGVFVSRLRLGDNIGRLRLPRPTAFAIGAAVFFAIILVGFAVRGIDILASSDLIVTNLASYTVTHPFAFSDWLSRYLGGASSLHYDDVSAPVGYYTFGVLFNLFGVEVDLPEGTFGEYFSQDDVLAGNIYTMYRGLILDFGVAGSLLFMSCIGLAFGQLFRRCRYSRWAPLSVTLYCFSLGVIQQSALISFAMYTSFYVGIVVLAAIVGVVLSFDHSRA